MTHWLEILSPLFCLDEMRQLCFDSLVYLWQVPLALSNCLFSSLLMCMCSLLFNAKELHRKNVDTSNRLPPARYMISWRNLLTVSLQKPMVSQARHRDLHSKENKFVLKVPHNTSKWSHYRQAFMVTKTQEIDLNLEVLIHQMSDLLV